MHGHEIYGRGKSFRGMAFEITKEAKIQYSWSCKSFPGCLHLSMMCLSAGRLATYVESYGTRDRSLNRPGGAR